MSKFVQLVAIILLFNFVLEHISALHPFLDEISYEIEDTDEKEDLEEKNRHKLINHNSFFDFEFIFFCKTTFPEFFHSFYNKKPALEIIVPPPEFA